MSPDLFLLAPFDVPKMEQKGVGCPKRVRRSGYELYTLRAERAVMGISIGDDVEDGQKVTKSRVAKEK